MSRRPAEAGADERWLLPVCILSGITVFCCIYPVHILSPTFISWLYEGDMAQHWLGWAFFRNEPWHFPFGVITSYQYPTGTSLVYMDALPLLALPLKLLSPLLPASFQYHGLWLLSCYLFMGYFSARLFRTLRLSPLCTYLGTLLFLLAPTVVLRAHHHETLAAQWMIVAALSFYFKPLVHTQKKWVLLLLCAVLTHFYLYFMVLILFGAALLKTLVETAFRQWRRCALLLCLVVAGSVTCMWMAGYFVLPVDRAAVEGFGFYSMNLTALWNPWVLPEMNTSSLFSGMEINAGQYEGYSYMGCGGLLLLAAAGGLAVSGTWKSPPPGLWLLLAAAAVCTGLALSNRIAWGTTVLWEYRLPQVASLVTDTLRSSGRFFWPVYYLLLTGGVVLVCRRLPSRWSAGLLSSVLLLQLVDLGPWYLRQKEWPTDSPYHFDTQSWQRLAAGKRHIAFVPPENQGESWLPFAFLAARNAMTLNVGYTARSDVDARIQYSERLLARFRAGELAGDTLYIINSPWVESAEKLPNLQLLTIDNFLTGQIEKGEADGSQ